RHYPALPSFPTRRSSDLLNSYDAAGNRTGVTTPGGTTSYAYDLANRMVSATDPALRNTSFGYDTNGNVSGIGRAHHPVRQVVGRSEEHTSELQSRFDLVC